MENSFSGEWPEKGHAGAGSASVSFPWSFPGDYSAAATAFLSWPAQPFEEAGDDRALSASKSHSEAEKRRRDRINAQLATLRKLIPKSEKVTSLNLIIIEIILDSWFSPKDSSTVCAGFPPSLFELNLASICPEMVSEQRFKLAFPTLIPTPNDYTLNTITILIN
nr:transcription factor bHLH51 [Ipomoea batatas]